MESKSEDERFDTILQKLIIVFFGLTIIAAVAGLLMFYVEKPYIGKVHCPDTFNLSADFDELPVCTHDTPKDASPLMEGIINSSVVFGIIFLGLSGWAYVRKRNRPVTPEP